MFRIRRIFDDVLPVNRQALREVQEILRARGCRRGTLGGDCRRFFLGLARSLAGR